MSNHGLFVGVSAVALALAIKMARRSLASALRRAMATRWSSGVAPGLPQEWLSDSEWGLGREAVPFYVVLRNGGPFCEGQWKTKVLKVPG
jgi:hypothetical protein